jgi:transcriptional regulator with XRE-family HTH domain
MFGDRLKLLRTQRGLSQGQMAEQLGFKDKVSTYRAYELEYSQPSVDLLINMADFFGVTVDYLIGRTEASNRPPIPEIELMLETDQRGRYGNIINNLDSLLVDTQYRRDDLMVLLLDLIENLNWIFNGSYAKDARIANGGTLQYDEKMTSYLMNDLDRVDSSVINPLRKQLINMVHLKYNHEIHAPEINMDEADSES